MINLYIQLILYFYSATSAHKNTLSLSLFQHQGISMFMMFNKYENDRRGNDGKEGDDRQ